MINMTFRRVKRSYYDTNKHWVSLFKPKSIADSIVLCEDGLGAFFAIPNDVQYVTLHVDTKIPDHKDYYDIRHRSIVHLWVCKDYSYPDASPWPAALDHELTARFPDYRRDDQDTPFYAWCTYKEL